MCIESNKLPQTKTATAAAEDKKKEEELSIGMKIVTIDFNPSDNPKVDRIKRAAAAFIDTLAEVEDDGEYANGGIREHWNSVAVDHILLAQMLGVKAATSKLK